MTDTPRTNEGMELLRKGMVTSLIRSRRKRAEELEKRADVGGGFLLSPEALRAEAIIARWEADTLERDGTLPDDYLDALK